MEKLSILHFCLGFTGIASVVILCLYLCEIMVSGDWLGGIRKRGHLR